MTLDRRILSLQDLYWNDLRILLKGGDLDFYLQVTGRDLTKPIPFLPSGTSSTTAMTTPLPPFPSSVPAPLSMPMKWPSGQECPAIGVRWRK